MMAGDEGSERSARNQAGSAAVRPWHDAITVSSIVLSAGTYLFDFVSNMVVLVEYSTRYAKSRHREGQGSSGCDARCRVQTMGLTGYFYSLLAILAFCHSLNALLFKLKFTHNEAPLCAAYFLPLIHLYRLCNLLWRTLSCKGVEDVRSSEMNGLYCILGSAMEGVPMLTVQFCAYLVLTREGVLLSSMSTIFKVSVAASLMSAAYNGGTSVQSIAKNATTTLKQRLIAAVIGGSFTLNATVVRCLTFVNIDVHISEYFSQLRTERQQAKLHLSDSLNLVVIPGGIVAYTLYFWLLHSPIYITGSLRNRHRLLTALAFSYLSMNLGPLYPLISQANDAGQLGGYLFRRKLFAVSLLHLSLDLAILIVTNMLGTLPIQYLIVSSLAAGGYVVSLMAYMKFDQSCGPTRDPVMSSSSHRQQYEFSDGNDTNDHTLIPMDMLADGQTYSQVMMMSKEVDAFSHVTPSSQSPYTSESSENEEPIAFSPTCPFPLEKHCVCAPPSVSLKHDVHFTQRAQPPCTGPPIASSLSLDRGKSLTITRQSNPSMATKWASFNGCSSSYSKGSAETRPFLDYSRGPVQLSGKATSCNR